MCPQWHSTTFTIWTGNCLLIFDGLFSLLKSLTSSMCNVCTCSQNITPFVPLPTILLLLVFSQATQRNLSSSIVQFGFFLFGILSFGVSCFVLCLIGRFGIHICFCIYLECFSCGGQIVLFFSRGGTCWSRRGMCWSGSGGGWGCDWLKKWIEIFYIRHGL